ncbi:MAG: hypothetical protein IJT73_04935 [Selenomonadaceae bacterium]|nr:hypothetical protein [Selenomonadaceae bacterium]
MADVKKFLIECDENYNLKTYIKENEKFLILKLHGGDNFKLTPANAKDYWRQWEQETGYTSDEFADICLIWRDNLDLKNFVEAEKNFGVKNISNTTWTSQEIWQFFSFTNRPSDSSKKFSLQSKIPIKFPDGKKFFIVTLNNSEKNFMPEEKIQPEKKVAKVPVSPKNSATPEEVKNAFRELSRKHFTENKEE